MRPPRSKPLSDYFKEGLDARLNGKTLHDNPYSAGSVKRREWSAGFCATVDTEDEDDVTCDPSDERPRPLSD